MHVNMENSIWNNIVIDITSFNVNQFLYHACADPHIFLWESGLKDSFVCQGIRGLFSVILQREFNKFKFSRVGVRTLCADVERSRGRRGGPDPLLNPHSKITENRPRTLWRTQLFPGTPPPGKFFYRSGHCLPFRSTHVMWKWSFKQFNICFSI